ncbi:MAG: hypothetical protein VX617_00640 [Pseudomonadota bacterium]|nr:hypothetical protein [Pseudomonadota bacterium]
MDPLGIITPLKSEGRFLQATKLPKQISHIVCGMGSQAAERAANQLIAGGCRLLISYGYAGAINQKYSPGDLVIGCSVSNGSQTLKINTSLAHKFLRCLQSKTTIKTHVANIYSSTKPLLNWTEKREVCIDTNFDAVDMESFAIGTAALQNGISFLIVRSILDNPESKIPSGSLRIVNEFGEVSLFYGLLEIAKSPREISNYISLATSKKKADSTLRSINCFVSLLGIS